MCHEQTKKTRNGKNNERAQLNSNTASFGTKKRPVDATRAKPAGCRRFQNSCKGGTEGGTETEINIPVQLNSLQKVNAVRI